MDPALPYVATGCMAFAIGASAVVANAAIRLRVAAKRIQAATASVESMSLTLVERLADHEGHDARVTELLEAIERHRKAVRAAQRTTAAYQEVIANQGAEIEALRSREAERIEEQELLEQELAATKAALAAEERQADTWAQTARNLGWSPGAAPVAALGAPA